MKNPHSPRLLYANYRESDGHLLRALFADEKVMLHVDRGPMRPEEIEILWRRLLDEFYPDGKNTIWGVFSRSDANYIGHAAIRPRPTHPDDWEISYIIRQEFWRRGFGTEIAAALVRFGFEELLLAEIFATIDDENESSIRVAQKVGLEFLRYEFDEVGRFSVFRVKRRTAQDQFVGNRDMPLF